MCVWIAIDVCVVFTFRACDHAGCGHIVVEHLLGSALGTEREYDYSMCTIDISPRETLKRTTHFICILNACLLCMWLRCIEMLIWNDIRLHFPSIESSKSLPFGYCQWRAKKTRNVCWWPCMAELKSANFSTRSITKAVHRRTANKAQPS